MEIIEFAKGHNEVCLLKNIGNRGDKLIELGTLEYFSRYNIKVNLIEFNDTEKEGDLLFVSGSGAFYTDYCYNIINAIEKRYKKFKKIVILPSTFDLSSQAVRDWASNLPDHVTVFCREQESYNQMREFSKNVFMSIDMAFHFNFQPYKKNNNGTLVCFRKDGESSLNTPSIKEADCSEDLSLGDSEDYKSFLRRIAAYENVHTDRLHVCIAAALLGKNVTLYSNSYFKNKAVFDYSLRHYPNVKFKHLDCITLKGNVSLVCCVMNREFMLMTSLFSWLRFKEIGEIIILDWSSKKDLSWVLDVDDRIKYIRVEEEEHFNISQAYNLAIDHATKDYVLKMDVDYILNPYYNFFLTNPIKQESFYGGISEGFNPEKPMFAFLCGILYIKKEDFYKAEGYNENYQGYGHEDHELYETLEKLNLKRLGVACDYSVMHTPHPQNFRTCNYKANLPSNDSILWWEKRRIVEWDLSKQSDKHIVAKKNLDSATI